MREIKLTKRRYKKRMDTYNEMLEDNNTVIIVDDKVVLVGAELMTMLMKVAEGVLNADK